jgi:membrane protein DedA with SNARE-associated domain
MLFPFLSDLNLLHLVSQHGQLALFAILFVEEAGVPLPIPGDVILVFTGVEVMRGRLPFIHAALASIGGVTLGSSLLFFICRLGGRPLVDRFGKYFFLPRERVKKLEKWFLARGRTAVLVGRFIPGIRVVLSAVAGLLELPYRLFLPQIILASFIWVIALTWFGYYLGHRWHAVVQYLAPYGFFCFVLFLITIVLYTLKQSKLLTKVVKRRNK